MVGCITNNLFSSRGINYSLLNDQKQKRRPIWFLRRASLNDEMASCRIRMVSWTNKIFMSHDLWYHFLVCECPVGTNWPARCLFFFLVPLRLYSFLSFVSQLLSWSSRLLLWRREYWKAMPGAADSPSFGWNPHNTLALTVLSLRGLIISKTWYRLILSGEEKISPITHRGILGDLSSWVQWSIFRVYISCRWELFFCPRRL